ncbi:acylphosphatase [Nicoliella spurrieriana]|uniref:acylphosphatase n=1 Tax=Nicoliella spurrieriana TaxID=2925830 RepID=A0A976RS92_9LACO|nr:acylphosphatase [Nicoliella spurrieriana]UQS86691.1 acylphosphatase [Nicoliella spurrieriana]
MKPTLELIAFGTVQGVGFRWATKQIADQLGLNGSVTNLADGSVKILAQGDHHKLDQLVQQIKTAPTSAAEVTDVSLRFIKHDEFKGFSVN